MLARAVADNSLTVSNTENTMPDLETHRDYQRIATAIDYLVTHCRQQPSMQEVAAQLGVSSAHFQRMFCRWAGISPKRFLQLLTVEQGKQRLLQAGPLLAVADDIGLSSASRLYDHFVTLEAMTPDEFRRRARGLDIGYARVASPFGDMLVAATARGICQMQFVTEQMCFAKQLSALQQQWPEANFLQQPELAATISELLNNGQRQQPVTLDVAASNFQLSVWRALLQVPPATLCSYSDLAAMMGRPSASRAVASAVAANPIALLIPCHRVVRRSGALGGYRWGAERKRMIQYRERLQQE